jgi:hypothetical protein
MILNAMRATCERTNAVSELGKEGRVALTNMRKVTVSASWHQLYASVSAPFRVNALAEYLRVQCNAAQMR